MGVYSGPCMAMWKALFMFMATKGANVFCFLSSLPLLPQHHGSIWLAPGISLLLTSTASPVRACVSIWLERFRGNQKEGVHGPLSVQSSLMTTQEELLHGQILHLGMKLKTVMVFVRLNVPYPTSKPWGSPGANAAKFTLIPLVPGDQC